MAIDPKSLTIDYRTLLKNTSISDRVELTKSQSGQKLLSTLTPSQISDLFPDYYKRANPDVSGFIEATARRYRQTAPGAPKGVRPGQEFADKAREGERRGQSGLGGLGTERRTGGRTGTNAEPSVVRRLMDATGDEKYGKYVPTGGLSDAGVDKVLKMTGRLEASQKGSENVSNDTEGSKSYGRLGLNTRGREGTRSIDTFLSQNPQFKDQLTARPGSPEFDQQWKNLARSNPEAIAQAERNWYRDNVISGTQNRMKAAGIPENVAQDPRVIAYFADREIQQGTGSTANDRTPPRIAQAIKLSGNDPEKFLKEFSRIDSSREAMQADFPNALRTGVYNLPGHQNRISGRLSDSLGMGAEDVIPQGDAETAKNALPQGIDTRIIQQYRTIRPDQRDEFAAKITQDVEKMGGVDKFNDRFSRRESTASAVTGVDVPLSQGAATRDYSLSKMNPELRARLAAAYNDLPPEIRKNMSIGSGFRDPTDPRVQQMYRDWQSGSRDRPMADPRYSQHGQNTGESGAADIAGLPKDPESVRIIREVFAKHGLHDPVGKERFHDSGMTHVQIKPGATQNKQYAPEFLAKIQQNQKPEEAPQATQQQTYSGNPFGAGARPSVQQQTQIPAAQAPAQTKPKYVYDEKKLDEQVNKIYDNPDILPPDKAAQLKTGKAMPLVSETYIKKQIKEGIQQDYEKRGFKVDPQTNEITNPENPAALEELPKEFKQSSLEQPTAAALGDEFTVNDPSNITATPIADRRDTGGRENMRLYAENKTIDINANEGMSYNSDTNKLKITPEFRNRPEQLAEQRREQTRQEEARQNMAQRPGQQPVGPHTSPQTNQRSDLWGHEKSLAPISHFNTDAFQRMVGVNEKFGFGDHYGYAGINS